MRLAVRELWPEVGQVRRLSQVVFLLGSFWAGLTSFSLWTFAYVIIPDSHHALTCSVGRRKAPRGRLQSGSAYWVFSMPPTQDVSAYQRHRNGGTLNLLETLAVICHLSSSHIDFRCDFFLWSVLFLIFG